MVTINEDDFKRLINDILIVQFTAPWCGPCKVLTQTIDTNMDKFNNPIYKLNIDVHHTLASALGIRSVPTLIRF